MIDTTSSLAATVSVTSAAARRWSIALAASAVVLTLISAALVWALIRARSEPTEITRYTVTPAEDQPVVHVGGGIDTALSPDGSWMVYVGRAPGGGTMLLRRDLDDLKAVAVPGSEGATAPAVSPDGRSIAFVANGGIRTVPTEGGPPFTVVTSGSAPTWSDDGMLYYGQGNVTHRVSAQGGEPAIITTPQANIIQRNPDALPNGRGLLLTLFEGTPAQARIAVVSPDGGTARPILTGTMARYASGHIVYGTVSGTVMAAPFDAQRLELTGPSVPLVEGVAVDADGSTQFTVSRSGALLYSTGTGFESELVWVTRDGVVTPMDSTWTGEFTSPALSPDGTRLAVALQGPESRDIWVAQFDRGAKLRLTLDGTRNDYPTWTPDGGSITFSSNRVSPSFDLWTKRSDGSGDPKLELDEEFALAEALWSPNGEWFVHRTSTNVAGAGDIVGRRTGKDMKAVPLAASRFTELTPAISPNSRWMAYASSETGRSEIVVVPFPNTGDSKWAVSVGGGSEPLWSHDGKELFYRNAKGELVSVRVETERAFSIGPTTALFADRDYMRLSARRQYDVTPDGQRFVLIRPVGSTRERRVILVRNVFSELTRAKN